MKIKAMPMLVLTTLVLVMITILATLNASFSWVFYLTILGQGLLLVAVYKVLTDDYKTDKEFKDFYEDRPDLGE